MKQTVLVGGGGHARSVVAMMEGSVRFLGYCDPKPSEGMTIPYLGTDDEVMARYTPEEIRVHVAVGFNDGCRVDLRRRILRKFEAYEKTTLIAPSAWVAPGATVGDGSAIMARATVNVSSVAENVIVNTGAIIEHDCTIGREAFIGPGAIVCGGSTIGSGAFIGAGATLVQGTEIADDTVIGMGAVVASPLEDQPGVYLGIPAKKKKI